MTTLNVRNEPTAEDQAAEVVYQNYPAILNQFSAIITLLASLPLPALLAANQRLQSVSVLTLPAHVSAEQAAAQQAAAALNSVTNQRDRAEAVVEAAHKLTSHGPLGILGTTDPDPGPRVRWAVERDERWAALREAVDGYRAGTRAQLKQALRDANPSIGKPVTDAALDVALDSAVLEQALGVELTPWQRTVLDRQQPRAQGGPLPPGIPYGGWDNGPELTVDRAEVDGG